MGDRFSGFLRWSRSRRNRSRPIRGILVETFEMISSNLSVFENSEVWNSPLRASQLLRSDWLKMLAILLDSDGVQRNNYLRLVLAVHLKEQTLETVWHVRSRQFSVSDLPFPLFPSYPRLAVRPSPVQEQKRERCDCTSLGRTAIRIRCCRAKLRSGFTPVARHMQQIPRKRTVKLITIY